MAYTVLMVGAFGFPARQGSQVYVAGMARALAAAGHRVLLAAYGHGEGAWPDGVERWSAPRLPVGTLRSGPALSKAVLDPLLLAQVVRALRTVPVDVVHAHHVEAPALAAAAMRLAGRRVGLVINPHTALQEELPTYMPAVLARPVAAGGEIIDRWVATRADAAVAISPAAEGWLRSWGCRRVQVVPPTVDLAELAGGDAARARARWGLGHRPWVVYTGNVDLYQDLEILVAAVARTPEAGLMVVSGGDLDVLRGIISRKGLPSERVRLVRSSALADALDALAAGAVACLPRSRCAGFPIKVLNYLGVGRVTVAARSSAPALEGVVAVDDGDDVAMAGALQAVIDDPGMAEDLGLAGRRAVASLHAPAVAAAALTRLYDGLLAEGRPG